MDVILLARLVKEFLLIASAVKIQQVFFIMGNALKSVQQVLFILVVIALTVHQGASIAIPLHVLNAF